MVWMFSLFLPSFLFPSRASTSPSAHIHLVFPEEWGVLVTVWMEPRGLRGVWAMLLWSS